MNAESLVFLLALGAVLAGLGYLARRHRRQRRSSATVAAEAEVLRVWQDGEGPYCVEYRFTPAGGEPVTARAWGGCLRTGLPEAGERIRVFYNPADPRISRLADESCGVA